MSEKQLTVFAIGCHPDDIEFMMAGALVLLKQQGAAIHYMNVANGSCGTQEYSAEQIIRIRAEEARNAADFLEAAYYPSIGADLEIVYDIALVRKLTAIIRRVQPDIILTPSLFDYMEDHMNTARLVTTAAFCIGMPNFITDPPSEILNKQVALYHALPYGLQDVYQRSVIPHFTVDITSVIGEKTAMLGMHKSQRSWLDDSQKLDSYTQTMREMSAAAGRRFADYDFGEGLVRHNPLGYSEPGFRPLEEALSAFITEAKPAERSL